MQAFQHRSKRSDQNNAQNFDFYHPIFVIFAYDPHISAVHHKPIFHILKMAEKEGGIVKKGHEEGLKMAISLLEEFGLPLGLLPLAEVIEVGFVRSTGYMWIVQEKKVEHEFKIISKTVSYSNEINGYIEMKKIKKLHGVKAKELVLWPPVSEIRVDDPPTGKIHFRSLAGITKTFPVEAFALGQ